MPETRGMLNIPWGLLLKNPGNVKEFVRPGVQNPGNVKHYALKTLKTQEMLNFVFCVNKKCPELRKC